jgi:hypothetical protein
MTHGFTRITGIALAVLLSGSGAAWAGGYIDKRMSAEAQSSSPSVGGALDTDTSVDNQVEPNVKPPEEPSASPRMETQPGARERRAPGPDRPAPRSDEHVNRPDAQSPRSDDNPSTSPRPDGAQNPPDVPPRRQDGGQPQRDWQSPRTELTPGQAEQPLRSYKQ